MGFVWIMAHLNKHAADRKQALINFTLHFKKTEFSFSFVSEADQSLFL